MDSSMFPGEALRQNRVRGRAAGQGPFFRLSDRVSKSQNLTGSTFCQFWHFLGLTLKIFSDFVPDRVQISPKFCLLGYEFCQKFVSDRFNFSNSSGTSLSVVKVSAPPPPGNKGCRNPACRREFSTNTSVMHFV